MTTETTLAAKLIEAEERGVDAAEYVAGEVTQTAPTVDNDFEVVRECLRATEEEQAGLVALDRIKARTLPVLPEGVTLWGINRKGDLFCAWLRSDLHPCQEFDGTGSSPRAAVEAAIVKIKQI